MPGQQVIVLIGHLTADPVKRGSGERAPTVFTLAVNERYKDKEHTEFIPIVTWGKTAEIALDMRKGDVAVVMDGKLRRGEWEKDGVKRVEWSVHSNFVIAGGGTRGRARSPEPEPAGDDDSRCPF